MTMIGAVLASGRRGEMTLYLRVRPPAWSEYVVVVSGPVAGTAGRPLALAGWVRARLVRLSRTRTTANSPATFPTKADMGRNLAERRAGRVTRGETLVTTAGAGPR